jgi:hypothetical protein
MSNQNLKKEKKVLQTLNFEVKNVEFIRSKGNMSSYVNALVSSEREKEKNDVKKSKVEVMADISALEARGVVLKFAEDREGTGLSPERASVIDEISALKAQLEADTAMEFEEQRRKEKEAAEAKEAAKEAAIVKSELIRKTHLLLVWGYREAVVVGFRNMRFGYFDAIYGALLEHEPSLFSERDDPQNFELLVKRAGNREFYTDLKNHTQEEIYSEQRKVLLELKRIEDLYLSEPLVNEK